MHRSIGYCFGLKTKIPRSLQHLPRSPITDILSALIRKCNSVTFDDIYSSAYNNHSVGNDRNLPQIFIYRLRIDQGSLVRSPFSLNGG